MPADKNNNADWHALSTDEALAALDAREDGLDGAGAEQRLRQSGPNALPAAPARPLWQRLLAQFHNVLIYVLIGAALLAAALGHLVDAAVIAAVVVVNALIGLVQEGKAERAMDAIGRMLALKARARRDGCWQSVPAESLVPGDIVQLRAGDRVPADIRLLQAHGLRVDQAALTGESVPVSKTIDPVDSEAALADRRGVVHSGCLVTGGQATGLVVATGAATELGRISHMLGSVRTLTTPLLQQINRFGILLSATLLALTLVVIVLGMWLHAMPFGESLLAGVALVVAAIPEGLPAIITITLAIGVQRMAVRKAIIRRLPAVETLGSVTTICSDKTGTLTRNELKAERVMLASGATQAGALDTEDAAMRRLAETGALCNDAEPAGDDGDPIERALVMLAHDGGVDVAALRRRVERLGLLPFSSDLKFMATAHADRTCVKGAPEQVLDMCASQYGPGDDSPLDPAYWLARLDELTGDGFRVLALADGAPADHSDALSREDLAGRLRLLGLVAFEDPPRDAVPAAVAACRAAGITVKMITGDHAATAAAIARRLDMDEADKALTGPELDRLSDDELSARVQAVAVYARTSPEHKLRLVKALQARGEVVAMTGDGANDAPALKRADIGVAMGIKGTEASRQAAEMVLADDNFASIVSGIEEGRGVYDNIRKAILFILPTNAAEALVVMLAVLAGLSLPITPVQILWINMATAVTLALALAFEPVEGDVMRRPPRPRSQGLITAFVAVRIAWVGILLTVATFGLFQWSMQTHDDEALARTLAVNFLVVCEMVYLLNCRRWHAPVLSLQALLANGWAWLSIGVLALMQLAFTYLPPAQHIFGSAALDIRDWLLIIALALPLMLLVEGEKWLYRRRAGHSVV